MKQLLAAILTCFTINCFAASEGGTGNAYYDGCKNHLPVCQSLLQGIKFGIYWAMGYAGGASNVDQVNKMTGICIPDDASLDQQQDVVWHYLDDHPETRNDAIPALTVKAWHRAWPC